MLACKYGAAAPRRYAREEGFCDGIGPELPGFTDVSLNEGHVHPVGNGA